MAGSASDSLGKGGQRGARPTPHGVNPTDGCGLSCNSRVHLFYKGQAQGLRPPSLPSLRRSVSSVCLMPEAATHVPREPLRRSGYAPTGAVAGFAAFSYFLTT